MLWLLMAMMTFPLALWMARVCLVGLMWLLTR
jgi:hypothetical protein